MRHSKTTIILFTSPALILVIGLIYIPIIQNFYFSLYRWSAFSIEKIFVGFSYYARLINDPTFYIALRNNLIYAVVSLIFQVGFGLVIAAILEEKFVRRLQPFFRLAVSRNRLSTI